MWNFAALDRFPTINRRSYFQTDVTLKASSNARKILILSSIHPRTSSHLRKHRTSVPSRLQKLTGTVIRTKSAPQATPSHSRTPDAPSGPPQPHPRRTLRPSPATPPTHPQPHPRQSPRRTPPSIPALPLTPATHLTCTSPPKFACNSRTGVIQWYKVIQTSKVFRGNCMRNCST